MKKFRWIILPAALVAAAIFVPASPSTADEDVFGNRCPDGYMPMSSGLAQNEDRNGNGVVCVKPTNGQIHDDPNGQPYACNGFPTTPPECPSAADTLLIGDDILP